MSKFETIKNTADGRPPAPVDRFFIQLFIGWCRISHPSTVCPPISSSFSRRTLRACCKRFKPSRSSRFSRRSAFNTAKERLAWYLRNAAVGGVGGRFFFGTEAYSFPFQQQQLPKWQSPTDIWGYPPCYALICLETHRIRILATKDRCHVVKFKKKQTTKRDRFFHMWSICFPYMFHICFPYVFHMSFPSFQKFSGHQSAHSKALRPRGPASRREDNI